MWMKAELTDIYSVIMGGQNGIGANLGRKICDFKA